VSDAPGLDDMAEQIEVDEIEMHAYILRRLRRLITRNADCAYYFSILLRLMRSTKALAHHPHDGGQGRHWRLCLIHSRLGRIGVIRMGISIGLRDKDASREDDNGG
jgi:hypothetical protein